MTALRAACLMLGVPSLVAAVNTDGRDPASIPKLDVPPMPDFEDVEHPAFEPYPVEAGELQHGAFFEQFDGRPEDISATRWKVVSGNWSIETPTEVYGFSGDQGLVLKSEQVASGIVCKSPHVIDTTSGDKPFVVQYEVKAQKPMRCGGAYVKSSPPAGPENAGEMESNADTQYVVMFGPDRCGLTDKVHFISKERSGKEHHLVNPPRVHNGSSSSSYTSIVNPDQTYEIRRDGIVMKAGSSSDADEFDPPLAPPREIEDPDDVKPDTWVDDEYILDPAEPEKPADWDEDQPYKIRDPTAVKPANWHDDWPAFIPDPAAVKPALWDDDEDGEWQAPMIANPECAGFDGVSEGCGEWLAPLVKNPAWKGEWVQPTIKNPAYKGEWTPRLIPNPDFTETITPNKSSDNIGGVGFESLTVQGDISFDNSYIGQSVRDAENIGNATWSPKYYTESASQGRAADARREQAEQLAKDKVGAVRGVPSFKRVSESLASYTAEVASFRAAPRLYVEDTYNEFITSFRADKLAAIAAYPVTFASFALGITALTALVFGSFNAGLVALTGKQMPQAERQARERRKQVEKAEKVAEKAAKETDVPEVRVTDESAN